MFILSIIAIIVYNYKNPDQNVINYRGSKNIPVDSDAFLNSIKNNTESYIYSLAYNEFAKLYNEVFEENSWQRYALNEERTGYGFANKSDLSYNQDITNNIKIIKEYELNPNSEVTEEQYNKAIEKYNGYLDVLHSDNWKEYTKYKINSLNEEKISASEEDVKWLEIEIDINRLRLDNNIEYKNDMINTYIEQYREESYYLQSNEELKEKDDFVEKQIKATQGNISLIRYAIENNISQDISSEKSTIIMENKIDARISFIRTLENFNLIIVIIAIYISCIIVTEETNKRTIKSLLIKPHKRSSILISKMIACLITVLISMVFICVSQYIVGGLIYGFDSYNLGYIGYNFNAENVFIINVVQFILFEGLAKLPMYIIIILFCIFIGTINNNTSMSMILTLIIFILASTILAEWSKVESLATVSKYFITNNWDFSTYLFGNSSEIPGINLEFSIFIFIFYFSVLVISAIKIFNNKEINNR